MTSKQPLKAVGGIFTLFFRSNPLNLNRGNRYITTDTIHLFRRGFNNSLQEDIRALCFPGTREEVIDIDVGISRSLFHRNIIKEIQVKPLSLGFFAEGRQKVACMHLLYGGGVVYLYDPKGLVAIVPCKPFAYSMKGNSVVPARAYVRMAENKVVGVYIVLKDEI